MFSFLILPFSSQTLAQAPQTKISLTNKDYPTTNLIIGYPNGNEVTALIKVSDVTDTDGLAGFAFIIGLSLTVSLSSAQSNYYIVPTDKIIETAFCHNPNALSFWPLNLFFVKNGTIMLAISSIS